MLSVRHKGTPLRQGWENISRALSVLFHIYDLDFRHALQTRVCSSLLLRLVSLTPFQTTPGLLRIEDFPTKPSI